MSNFQDWLSQQPSVGGDEVPTGGDTAAPAAVPPADPSALSSFFMAASQAVNPFEEEFNSANQALWDKILGDNDNLSFEENYNRRLEQQRKTMSTAQEEHPIASLAGGISGGVSAAAVTPVAGASTALGAAARGAAGSGAQSLIQGFGSGEGGFMERLKSGGLQGLIGTTLGGIFGRVGATLSKDKQKIAQAAVQKSGEQLHDITQGAYKALGDAKIVIPGNEVTTRMAKAMQDIRSDPAYDPNSYHDKLDKFLDTQWSKMQSQTTQGALKPRDMTVSELDTLRKSLKQHMNATKEPKIMGLVRAVDDAINTSAQGNELVRAARDASRVERNTKLFDTLFSNASISSEASNSSKITAFKRSAAKMLTNPKISDFLEDEEKAILMDVVNSNASNKLVRFLGKYDPASNNFASLASALWFLNHPIAGIAAGTTSHLAQKVGERGSLAAAMGARNVLSGSNLPDPLMYMGQGPAARGVATGMADKGAELMDNNLTQNLMNSILNQKSGGLIQDWQPGQQQ